MDMVFTNGLTECNTKAFMQTTRSMAMEFIVGQTAADTRVSGKMDSNTGEEH